MLLERGETAVVGTVLAMVAALYQFDRIGSPSPLVPEALWVQSSLGILRVGGALVLAALGFTIVALMLRHRRWIVPGALVAAWTLLAFVLVDRHGTALAAVVRVAWNQ
ncbi:MAG: hypothetical protein KDA22_05875 [Phycisphaerales bacterium]|nr:hypothetical protein [Phycisphaerales bacterium]